MVSAVACLQKNAMFVVPGGCSVQETRDTLEKQNVTHVVTSRSRMPLLQDQAAKTLQMGLYPVGMRWRNESRRSAVCASRWKVWKQSSSKSIAIVVLFRLFVLKHFKLQIRR